MERRALVAHGHAVLAALARAQLPVRKNCGDASGRAVSAGRHSRTPNQRRAAPTHRKFSAVLGTMSANSSIFIRPTGWPPMLTSMKTTGLFGLDAMLATGPQASRPSAETERLLAAGPRAAGVAEKRSFWVGCSRARLRSAAIPSGSGQASPGMRPYPRPAPLWRRPHQTAVGVRCGALVVCPRGQI